MQAPLYERAELLSIGRVIGALLVFTGGLALLVQAYFVDLLPAPDGFSDTVATVIHREQTGSFQSPSFFITLEYEIPLPSGRPQTIRSGQGISFEEYLELAVGDEIAIHYDPLNTFEWRILPDNTELSQYGLGLLMLIFGLLSLSFPALINWASRRDDFDFTDEFDDELLREK